MLLYNSMNVNVNKKTEKKETETLFLDIQNSGVLQHKNPLEVEKAKSRKFQPSPSHVRVRVKNGQK